MSVKLLNKGEQFETLYIHDALVWWARLKEPVKDFNGVGKEYQMTIFVSKEDADKLQIDIGLNKEPGLVDVDKVKQGSTRGAFRFSSEKYNGTEGLYGIKLSMKELAKSGRPNQPPVVVNSDKEVFDGDIGNGSTVSIKLSGYRNSNTDALIITSIQMVMVKNLVEYESTHDSNTIYDEEFGVSIKKPLAGDDFDDGDDDFEDDDVDAFK